MKKKSSFRVFKRLSALVTAVLLMLAVSIPAFASSDADMVANDRSGVLTVIYGHVDGDSFTEVSVGSGFLINENTLLTCYHVIHITDSDDRDTMKEEFGKDWEKHMSIRVVYQVGNYYVADEISTVKNEFSDYTAIQIKDGKINNRTILTLSKDEVGPPDAVSALGFPYSLTMLEDPKETTYTESDVAITTGTINKLAPVSGVTMINHSATLGAASSGGPLVNASGQVIGINAGQYDSYYYAIPITQVITSLDTVGVEYSTSGSAAPAGESEQPSATGLDTAALDSALSTANSVDSSLYTSDSYAALVSAVSSASDVKNNAEATQDAVNSATAALESAISGLVEGSSADTAALNSAIAGAEALDSGSYSSDSYAALSSALNNAKTIVADPSATQESIDAAAAELQKAQEELKEKLALNPFMIGGIAAIIVIIVVVIIILVVNHQKKDAFDDYYESFSSVPPSKGAPSGAVGTGTTSGAFVNVAPTPAPSFAPNYGGDGGTPTGVLSSDAGETGVLNTGANETTVLSSKPYAMLTRKSTGETIQVAAATFLLGKERRKVTYCISDNTAVSRTHAEIVQNGGGCAVIDLNSKNGTFVNGVKCTPNAPVPLKNGDRLVLADEEFSFRTL